MSTRQLSRDLDGHPTEILVQTYVDRVFVLVTQLGKVGTLIQASLPDTTPLLPAPPPDPLYPNQVLPPPPPAIQLTPLFGSAPSEHTQTLHSLYAAQIATIVWLQEGFGSIGNRRRSVVVGLALKKSDDGGHDEGVTEREKVVFQGVMSSLQELLSRQ
ncbi:hypothetical protein LshimejAT787_0204520 [Lyophyllum shimeji]|uniref:Proteasome assembly chaperone 3 n=1 Tax=Lyophyllum shimeji TaxID=47721 RepID=A0A9P3UJ00_LYOSH|nr:hypothetical protein LshimejAT787_0204520 [Lyophyllum shimeji]